MKRSERGVFPVEEILCKGCDPGAWACYVGVPGRPGWLEQRQGATDAVRGRPVPSPIGPHGHGKF